MPTWPERLLSELNAADEHARKLVSGLTVEQLNWRPSEGEWSVGQCLDHLCVTNDVYLPAIAGALEDKAKGTAEEIRPGWAGRWFLKNVIEPSPKQKKYPAPKKIAPRLQVDAGALERFLTSNQKMRELIGRAREYDVNQIRFRNPFVALVRFTVGTGLEIVSQHQKRHLLQAERVKAGPEFPRQ